MVHQRFFNFPSAFLMSFLFICLIACSSFPQIKQKQRIQSYFFLALDYIKLKRYTECHQTNSSAQSHPFPLSQIPISKVKASIPTAYMGKAADTVGAAAKGGAAAVASGKKAASPSASEKVNRDRLRVVGICLSVKVLHVLFQVLVGNMF